MAHGSPGLRLLIVLELALAVLAIPVAVRPGALLWSGACLATSLLMGLRLRPLLFRLVPVAIFAVGIVVLTALVPSRHTGEVVTLGNTGLAVPQRALGLATGVLLKTTLLLCLISAAVPLFPGAAGLSALNAVACPRSLRAVLYLLVRSLSAIRRDLARCLLAGRARGSVRSLRLRLRLASGVARAMILRAGRRADSQAMALVGRGFTGAFPSLADRPMTAREWIVGAVLGLVALCTVRL